MKSGKVAVVLRGRYAGRKAVVIKTFEEGTGKRKFGHAIGKLEPLGRGTGWISLLICVFSGL